MNSSGKKYDFPSKTDFVNAVTNTHSCIFDYQLRNGTPRRIKNSRLELYSGGYSCVFPIDIGNKTYALRCWTAEIGDSKFRYQAIENYLKKKKLSYFIDFSYVKEGILARGKRWDIVRMEWVNGLKLKDYLKANLYNKIKLMQLASSFLNMFKMLHTHEIAHGDLQHENVLVKDDGSLILVDYDSLYVPTLNGKPDLVKGLSGYQHPKRFTHCKITNKKLDYFSELVIYLSILAISEKPNLWNKYKVADSNDFLFSGNDFLLYHSSPIFNELLTLSPKIQDLTTKLQAYCQLSSIEQLKKLENLLKTPADTIIEKFPPRKPKKETTSQAAKEIIEKIPKPPGTDQ